MSHDVVCLLGRRLFQFICAEDLISHDVICPLGRGPV